MSLKKRLQYKHEESSLLFRPYNYEYRRSVVDNNFIKKNLSGGETKFNFSFLIPTSPTLKEKYYKF